MIAMFSAWVLAGKVRTVELALPVALFITQRALSAE